MTENNSNISESSMNKTFIQVQTSDFDVGAEQQEFSDPSIGAVVAFTGLVREFSEHPEVQALTLEHYPGMTEKSLFAITEQARQRWPLQQIRIIHRIGRLAVGEQIVYVGVSSAHREAAFEGCRFIMDYLKTDAPFWKQEHTRTGDVWVDAREKDQQARQAWQTDAPDTQDKR